MQWSRKNNPLITSQQMLPEKKPKEMLKLDSPETRSLHNQNRSTRRFKGNKHTAEFQNESDTGHHGSRCNFTKEENGGPLKVRRVSHGSRNK